MAGGGNTGLSPCPTPVSLGPGEPVMSSAKGMAHCSLLGTGSKVTLVTSHKPAV